MGWLDWITGKPKTDVPEAAAPSAHPTIAEATPGKPSLQVVPPVGRRYSLHRDDLFDLARTTTLHQLFEVDRDARDDAWHAAFFDAAWHGSTELPAPTAFHGPDGFPYLRFDVPRGGAFESQSLGNLARSLVENACGAAIFASPDDPEDAAQFVFSMGRLDAMLRFDDANGDPVDRQDGPRSADPAVYDVEENDSHQRLTVRDPHEVMIGSPSADYLPPAAARGLYRHLVAGWKIADPKVGLMLDPSMTPSRTLMIGRRRDEFGEGQDPDGAARMLLWYLPPNAMVMLLPNGMDERELVPLSRYLGESAPAND